MFPEREDRPRHQVGWLPAGVSPMGRAITLSLNVESIENNHRPRAPLRRRPAALGVGRGGGRGGRGTRLRSHDVTSDSVRNRISSRSSSRAAMGDGFGAPDRWEADRPAKEGLGKNVEEKKSANGKQRKKQQRKKWDRCIGVHNPSCERQEPWGAVEVCYASFAYQSGEKHGNN